MKCTAYNKRFGISAGVFSQKHLYEFASLSPVRTAVKPPPTPSRRTLVVIIRKRTHDKQSKFKKRQLQTYASLFMNYRLEVWCGTLKT